MNTVLGTSKVIVTYRLPNSNIILIFRDNILVVVIQSQEQVTKAFRLDIKLYKNEYIVITKGLLASQLYNTSDKLLLKEIQTTILEAIRYKIEYYRDPIVRYTIYIIHLYSNKVVEKLYRRDLVQQAQIFSYKPFIVELQFYRYFYYHKFNYIIRYYKTRARYSYYTRVVYPEGEDKCPQYEGYKKYINYRGPYPTQDWDCLVVVKVI